MNRYVCCCGVWLLLLIAANCARGEDLSPELAELVDLVAGSNERAGIKAVQRLSELGEEALPAVPALIEVLNHDDVWRARLLRSQPSTPSTRAAAALTAIGDLAIPQLANALHGDSETRRSNIIWVLHWNSSLASLEAIGAATKSENEIVRLRAAQALGHHSRKLVAAEALIGALSDISAKVRAQAAWATASPPRHWPDTDTGDEVVHLRPRLVKALAPLLFDPEMPVRVAAAYALGKCPNDRAAEHLIAVLPKPDDKLVRVRIIESLGELADRRTAVPLLTELKKNDAIVTVAIIVALGKLQDPLATELLLTLLKNGSDDVRRSAAQSLGEIADRRCVAELIATLGDSNEYVRTAAARALSNIPDERSVEPLIGLLSDKESSVRTAAATALGAMNDARAIRPLAKALFDEKDRSTEFQGEIGGALKAIHHPDVVPALVEGILADGTGYAGTVARHTLEAVTGQSGMIYNNEVVAHWWKANRDYYQAAE